MAARPVFGSFPAVLDQTADAILVTDAAGALVYANRAGGGLPLAELPLGRALQGEPLRNVEVGVANRWYSLNADPVRDERGHPAGAIAVLRDITASKAEQDRLRRLARAVEHSPAAVLITNLHGEIEYVNPKFTEVTGYSREEVLGKNPRILKSGHQNGEFYATLWRTITAGRNWRGEFLNRRKSGEEFWEHASISPVLNAAGEVTHFVAVKEDITARKRMEEALLQVHDLLRQIVQTAPLAIITLDLEGRVSSWNPAAEKLFAWSAQEVLGQPLSRVSPEDWPMLAKTLERLRQGQTLAGFETRRRRKDGSILELTVWNAALRSSTGAPRGLVSILADSSARKRLEERLREFHKMEAVGRLAGGMAHDFNNLLMIVSGYAELLADSMDLGDARRNHVTEIQRAADRAAVLINQLLSFSQRQIIQPRLLRINRLLARVAPGLSETLGPAILLHLEPGPRVGPVRADPEQIEQLLVNFARNARDAMPDGGCFRVRTANVEFQTHDLDLQPGPYMQLTLSDTGRGMDEETRRHLFEPFFTTKGMGHGLALSSAYGIVRQAGGDIRVRSEPGRGCTFEVFLPRAGASRWRKKGGL